ncbi:MAG TPA: Gfo/Idh/MocA family oxidoreductase [Candidatus Lumbricidophila sp.]|nr:Gfo/Idh/MocA family oxidoreductase [Candidatus Lumbricidophila sp.]
MKIGICSFAHVHAIYYAMELLKRPGIEIVATDPDEQWYGPGEVRGRALAEQMGVTYVDSYDELFSWGPDAVIVTAENTQHRRITELAAAAGAHVLCEKPLATTEADAQAMIAACEAAGVVLMTAYPVQFAPDFVNLRSFVQRGGLGRVLSITGTNNGKIPVDRAWFTNPELAGGGSLVDHTVHCADLIDSLLDGAQAESVRAVTNQILHADKPQVAAETGGLVSVVYPGNLTAVIDCSWSLPDVAPNWGGLTLELVGTKGVMTIEPFAHHVGGYTAAGKAHFGYGFNCDAAMIDEFFAAINEGRAARPDGHAGLRSLRVVLAGQQSIAAGGVRVSV